MFALVKLLSSVLLIVAVGFNSSSAQSVNDRIDALKRSFDPGSKGPACKPDESDVLALLEAIKDSGVLADKIQGLRLLATLPYWKAAGPKSDYWKILLDISNSESFSLRYYAAIAMMMQDGELISALEAESEERIQFLLQENLSTNALYAAFARASLIQMKLWQLREVNPARQAGQPEIENLNVEVDKLFETLSAQEAASFFSPTSILGNVWALKSLLEEVFGDGAQAFITDEYKYTMSPDLLEMYNPNIGISQISDGFINIGYIAADIAFGRQSQLCGDTKHELLDNRFFKLAQGVDKGIINPLFLAEEACKYRSSEGKEAGSQQRIPSFLDLQNFDYRIILGHFRNGAVRYSSYSIEELMGRAEALEGDVQSANLFALSPERIKCLGGEYQQAFRPHLSAKIFYEDESKQNGYIYFGNGLSRFEATRVLNFLRGNSEFLDAYIFRPVDYR